MNKRPRLLFLACYFPPLNTIACVRTGNMAKYLTRRGWEVTVVTPDPSLWCDAEGLDRVTMELEREGVRRILTGYHWRCLAPPGLVHPDEKFGRWGMAICQRVARRLEIDRGIGWALAAADACSHLTPGDADVILATGSPFAAFGLAKRLSDRLGRPYVLDYRDPWTGNPHRERPPRTAIVRKEAALLANCSAATIVSESWAAALDAAFTVGPRLHVITNGYDPEELEGIQPHPFDHFAIVYTGGFYPPKRTIAPVMAALQRLKAQGANLSVDWRFHYYGGEEEHVRAAAAQFGVVEQTVLHGKVCRAEALAAVRGAGASVVITSVADQSSREDQGIVTGKVFEAVGLGTPVLLVAPPGSDAGTVVESAELGRRFTGSDVEGMASFLVELMHGRAPQPRNCHMYAWPSIGERMDQVLLSALESARTRGAAPRGGGGVLAGAFRGERA